MRLSGRDLRIIPGAIMVLLYIPCPPSDDHELQTHERDALEDLVDRFSASRDAAYGETADVSTMPRALLIARRLHASLAWNLSVKEAQLILKALTLCIREEESGRGVNVYFNGDEYGVTVDDLRALRLRLSEEYPSVLGT